MQLNTFNAIKSEEHGLKEWKENVEGSSRNH